MQSCRGNGRELLFISSHYGAVGTSFDIAENLIAQGQVHAKQLHVPCSFSAMNILDIGCEYHQKFDMTLPTTGAITRFQGVNILFQVMSDYLKPKGVMLVHGFHPLMNMLPLPGEDCYCDDIVRLLEHKYFTAKPWAEGNGMGYVSRDYASRTFTSFSYSISKLMNSIIQSGMGVGLLNEYGYDIGLSNVYDTIGLPLSMLLMAERVQTYDTSSVLSSKSIIK